MKTILWFQPSSDISNADIISFNGINILPPNSQKYRELYNELLYLDLDNQDSKYYSSREKLLGSTVCKISDGYLIKGYYNQKDEVGRNICFTFYSNTINKIELLNRIKVESELYGKTCTPETLNEIENYNINDFSSNKRWKFTLIFIIVITIITIAYFVQD